MKKRTIKVFKPCELCGGTGLEQIGGYASGCRNCLGKGETLEKEYREVNMNDVKLPAGRK